ncbi:zeta toxin family protein [Mycobacterium sp. WMMD1722]|uniref:zeta toxin family protein n=1 Tax=Mycobacterium sp. WMMD1722 TaxID=3404117 RepID=UPI003BF60B2A
MKRLDLVVGPNGAGKSTFVALTLGPLLPRSPFVNADEIARQRWPDDAEALSYEAARVAAATRSALIASGTSFIAETVFSHPSKLALLDEAHAQGYVVVLHVVAIPEDLAVQRVVHRVRAGGHRVAEDRIRERHRRLWDLVARAIVVADSATVYDNSGHAGPRVVARFTGGVVVGSPRWPLWTAPSLRTRWPD